MRVAALRELFEESNILLACQHSGRMSHECIGHQQLSEWRERVQRDSRQFIEMMGHFDLRLQTASLLDWAHWITPEAEKYR